VHPVQFSHNLLQFQLLRGQILDTKVAAGKLANNNILTLMKQVYDAECKVDEILNMIQDHDLDNVN